MPTIQAAPLPLLGGWHQVGFECVSLNVAANGVEVFVVLYGEEFESTLVDVTAAGSFSMSMPALGMGQGEPAGAFRDFIVLPEPEHQMPVIRHDAITQQSRFISLDCLRQHPLK